MLILSFNSETLEFLVNSAGHVEVNVLSMPNFITTGNLTLLYNYNKACYIS